MAYYPYYQSGGPWVTTWGTPQYQFQPPPLPWYQPVESWTPYDYFHHHADMHDSTFFDYVFSKVRNVLLGHGVSRGEAEHWHRRIYGGMVDIHELLPREVGAAAAWETLRVWQHHNSLYASSFAGSREREREAMIGLAIAEASRLWVHVGRPLDKYGRREAAEVAGDTASRIFIQMYDYDSPYEPYHSGGRWRMDDKFFPHLRRRSSFSGRTFASNGALEYDEYPIHMPFHDDCHLRNRIEGTPFIPSNGFLELERWGSPYARNQLYLPPIPTSPSQIIIESGSGGHHGHHHRRHHHHRRYSSAGFHPSMTFSVSSDSD